MAVVAARNWGVVDIAELRACGLSTDAIATRRRRGSFRRLFPGVYVVGATPLSMQSHFLAATKAAGPDAVLSHYSALALWRLVDYEPDSPVHVSVPHSQRRTIEGIVVHRTRNPAKPISVDAIPVTSPARALIDASSMLSFVPLRRAVREAMAMKRAGIKELLGHTKSLDEAIAQGYVPTRNEFEDAVHDLLLTTFEPPVAQQTLFLDGVPTTPDFRWPALNLCVEADGAQFHDFLLARQDDTAKQARLEAHGERVIRVTWTQATTQPEQTLTRIRAAGAPRRVQ